MTRDVVLDDEAATANVSTRECVRRDSAVAQLADRNGLLTVATRRAAVGVGVKVTLRPRPTPHPRIPQSPGA